MKRVFTLLMCLFTLATFAQVNQIDAKGKKQGVWEKVYPGTRVFMYRGEFKDDKPVGTFVYFYESGKSKAVVEHSGTSRSEGYFYHESGGVMSYGIYTNLKKDSIWVNWDKIGRLSSRTSYKNDSLHGMKVVYFLPPAGDKSQRPMNVYNYNNGLLEGEFKEYFDTGKLKVKGVYANNKKTGVWETYYLNGKKMALDRYKAGKRHGWSVAYNEKGNEEGRSYFYNGQLLEGKVLKKHMDEMKRLGLNPND